MSNDDTSAPSEGDARTTAVGGPSSSVSSAEALLPALVGDSLGRYVVLESVGAGGMGRVWRAYDPKLQREVALKVVHTRGGDDDARDRMLREARAMAKLSHPNVVAVYDAEDSPAGVILVMEFVAGLTLRAWGKRHTPAWSDIVARFVAAGRGLAAAHAVDLLHRDFKPANVLVADDGAVKVTDFGLAKLAGATGSDASRDDVRIDSRDSLDGTLTRADIVLGTPRYMSPEQHCGEPLTAAADQYSFCVALWEALCDAPPFPRGTPAELLERKQAGAPPWPSEAPAIPRHVVDALRRGLAPEPGDRWPDMPRLLDALGDDPSRRRTRVLGLGFGGLALVGLGAWAFASADDDRCTGAAAQLAGRWDETRRAEVQSALRGVDVGYADVVADRTVEQLDGYADGWTRMHTESCEATTVRGEQSAEVMDLRMACLQRAAVELGAVTEIFAAADIEVARRAHRLTDSLPALDRCADIDVLTADVEPPPAAEAEPVDAARRAFAQARALEAAARLEPAREARALGAELIEGLEYGPIQTELAIVDGKLALGAADYDAAQAAFERGLELAARWRQTDDLYRAARELMFVVGVRQKQPDAGMRYADIIEPLVMGDPGRLAHAKSTIGLLHHAAGRYDEAIATHREACKGFEEVDGPEATIMATCLNNLGASFRDSGRYDEALPVLKRSLAIYEKRLGADHPSTITTEVNLAGLYAVAGDVAGAEQAFRDAIARLSAANGAAHPSVAMAQSNLGQLLQAQGRDADAIEVIAPAIATLGTALGPDHPDLGVAYNNLALSQRALGDVDAAIRSLRRSIDLQVPRLGESHPNVVAAKHNLGLALQGKGDFEGALELFRQVAEVRAEPDGEASTGADVSVLRGIANVQIELGDHAAALTMAQRAWDHATAAGLDAGERTECALVLASAQWAASSEAEPRAESRARLVAERAKFTKPGVREDELRTAVDEWLAVHPES